MEWRHFKKDKKRKKLTIEGQLWDGRVVRLPGDRDPKVTEHKMRCIASLSRSKKLGELPDENLADWINGLPQDEAARYVALGLLPGRLLDKRRPIADLINEFAIHMKANLEDRSKWVKRKTNMIRRMFAAIGPHANFDNLDQDDVNVALKKMIVADGLRKGQPIAQKTKREHIFAMKSFCQWMVKKRGATKNPVEGMVGPSAKAAPVWNRRPMKVSEFSKLADYLRTAPLKYTGQRKSTALPDDRLMTYWMAVMTGFRKNELRSLTRGSIVFDANPVTVTVEGWNAKNRTKATVPIDPEFVPVLKAYAERRGPTDRLLLIPAFEDMTTSLYRDLDAAGVRRVFDDGTRFDFHSFRSTAIYWWLTVKRMDILEVQRRARLKTLMLVQEYVRNHVPDYGKPMDAPPEKLDFSMPIWRGDKRQGTGAENGAD